MRWRASQWKSSRRSGNGSGTRAGFADANTYASHEQHPKITGQAAECGHRTPYHHRDRQNFDATAGRPTPLWVCLKTYKRARMPDHLADQVGCRSEIAQVLWALVRARGWSDDKINNNQQTICPKRSYGKPDWNLFRDSVGVSI